uniref:NUC173 domain-containing protein n=2 Tax=Schistosoma mansoni TaxID=6183 RepID=A0A5K4F249_SCHMA
MASTISDVSFISWASAATECTNPTFKTALSRPWPNISMHRDVLSVLAAVTKTIKDNGGKESPTEYYAALLTLINESSEKVAVAYLLKLVMCKAVEDSLLRKTCGEAAKTLIKLLSSHNINTDACLIKSVLTCLGKLLRAQSYDSWSTESIRHVYRHVLRFVDSEKPSIRKSCHSSIVDILGSLNVVSLTGDVIFHPACHQTQEHLCSVIRQETRQLISSLHTKDVHCTRLLHCLDLLTSIMPLLPSKDVKLAFECVLELANFPNPLVVTKVFHSFKTMFDSKPSLKTLPIDIAARLLTALYSCRPNDPNVFTISSTNNTCTGVDALVSWMLALISGCAYLCGLSLLAVKTEDNELKKTIENVERFSIQRLANEHLDRLVKTLMSLLISTPLPQLREPVTQKLNQLFTEVVHPQLVSCQLADILPDFIPNVLCNFITGLQYTHYEIWNHMLCLIGRFTMIISKVFPFDTMLNFNSLVELLKVILHLRDCLVDGPKSLINLIHVDPENFSLIGLNDLGEKIIDGLDSVCLLAVEYIGPELILPGNIFSLEIIVEELETGKIDLQRSWFLPLLSRAVPQRSISLSIFHRHILPLADRALAVASLHSSTTVLSDKTKPPNNALMTSSIKVACQLWSSLNMFVHHSPIDWSELSTGGLGSRLVKELSSAPALRPIILHTFRRLAKLAVGNDPAITVMRGGAKTAIPNMLSLYETLDTVTQHSLKQKIQATLSYYLPILSPKMISSLTKTAMIKFENTKEPVYLEIFQILIAYNSVQELEQIITRINEYLNDVQLSKPLRKRVCRVLESICAGSTSQTDEFLNLHFNDVIHMIYGLTKKPVTNNSTTVTSLTDKKSLKTDNNLTQTIEEKLTTLSVCEMKIGKPKKLSQFFIPWKSILRCIQHLFKRLVTNELNTIINTNQSSDDDLTTKNLMDNERLKEFANMFLPEILTCLCELNQTVRNLAGNLLIGLVYSFAGQQAWDKNKSYLPIYQSQGNLTFDSRSSRPPTIMNNIMNDDTDSEDDNVDFNNKSTTSSLMGGSTYSDGEDNDDIMSTKSMPRGSLMSQQICHALNLVLSRLWPCLPPHNRPATNSIELALQQSSARAICLLMKHWRFRQALILNINSESCLISQLVSTLLSEVNLISQCLVQSNQRKLIRLGLQLARSLILFIKEGSISLASVLETLQSIHSSCKRPLRFVVKSILEKMIKKFGRQAIQGLLSVEHQKMVRNSVKLMARRERKSKMLEESTSKTTPSSSSLFSGSTRRQISDSDSDHTPKRSISSDIKSIRSSIHSKPSSLSLPKRVHITRMDELLATSSSDDDRSSIHSHAKSNRSQTRSSSCGSSLKNTKSLVEELENAKLTAGLCRRSRRNLTENGSFNMIDNMDIDFGAYSENDDDDDEEINKALCKNPFKSKHQVRFAADTISHTSKPRSQVSRHTSLSAVTAASSRHPPSNDSDLWLVENPESSEILDLSDPKSLARHTAFAPDDMTAKAMVNIFQNSLAEQSKSSASQSINKHNDQPFPIVNGKIVINDGTIDENQSILTKKDHLEWDLDGDDDNDANIQSTSCVNKNDIKHRKKKTIPIPGRIYASSKARGDMKRAGMPEPFAFVPLGAGIGKSNNSISQRVTPLERRRLLREVGMGKQKRKRIQGGKHMKSSKNIVLKDVHKKTKFLKLSKAKFPRDNM